METTETERRAHLPYQAKMGELFLGLNQWADPEGRIRTLSLTDWSTLDPIDAFGLLSFASRDHNPEVRSVVATILGKMVPLLVAKGHLDEQATVAYEALGRLSRDSDDGVREAAKHSLEGLKDHPDLMALTDQGGLWTIPSPVRTHGTLLEGFRVEELPGGDIVVFQQSKDLAAARQALARALGMTGPRTTEGMAQEELSPHPPVHNAPPVSAQPTMGIPDSSGDLGASSASPPVQGPDGASRAAPTEYVDWPDEEYVFDIVPGLPAGTTYVRFVDLGRAMPTPYDFDD